MEAAEGTFDLLVNAVKENLDNFFNDFSRQYAFLTISFLAICGGGFVSYAARSDETIVSPIFVAYMFAFVLGCLRPKGFWLAGIVIGTMTQSVEFAFLSAFGGTILGAIFRKGLDYGAKHFA